LVGTKHYTQCASEKENHVMQRNRFLAVLIMLALFASQVASFANYRPTQAQAFSCFPTCEIDSGRHLVISSQENATLGDAINISFGAPAGTTSFTFGIFDGDHTSTSTNPFVDPPPPADLANYYDPTSFWDFSLDMDPGVGRIYPEITYTLFADPLADGSTLIPVASYTSRSPEFAGDTNPADGFADGDDTWVDFTITTSVAAQAPSGNYFYRLQADGPDSGFGPYVSTFKIRTTGFAFIAPQVFGIVGAIYSINDRSIIYPPDGTLTNPTTYDGNWRFNLYVTNSTSALSIWDGDFDHGRYDCSTRDTDDPNTSNIGIPPFANVIAVPEGIGNTGAVNCLDAGGTAIIVGGSGLTTGNPPDDQRDRPTDLDQFRVPDINYTLTDQFGNSYANPNPSGNREWENFVIGTGTFNPATMDVLATTTLLSQGIWNVDLNGADLQNLSFWRFDYPVVCEREDGSPCDILAPYIIGDRVWEDSNGNGIQDVGEAGIPGVVVELYSAGGGLISTTTTGLDGIYNFQVFPGTYAVRVSGANYSGPLAGMVATTAENLVNTVTTENVLTYDFGYRRVASPTTVPPGTTTTTTGTPVTLPATGYPPADNNNVIWFAMMLAGFALLGGISLRLRKR
jgi:hypothetical protein